MCPHFSHHVWFDVLKEKAAISWPAERPVDKALSRSYGFLRSAARQLRLDSAKELKSLKGKKPAGAYVYVATTYPDWRKAVLKTARDVCNGSLVEKKELLGALKKDPAFAKDGPFAKQAKLAMQFGSFQHVLFLRPLRRRRVDGVEVTPSPRPPRNPLHRRRTTPPR